jgi:hypothetical protein
MTARQRALLAYVATIAQHVRGFSSPDDLVNRVMKCVRQDAAFIAEGTVKALIDGGQRALERGAHDFGEALGRHTQRFVGDLFKKVRR